MKSKNKKKILDYNIDFKKYYNIEKIIKIIKKINYTKFISSINLTIVLKKKKNKVINIKKVLLLPYGSKLKKKILVFNKNKIIKDKINKLKFKKYIILGDINILNKIEQKKKINYYIILSDKHNLDKIIKLAKILGPKGLIPNNEEETITENPIKLIEDIYNGKRKIMKTDKYGIIHLMIGKIKLKEEKIIKNIKYVLGEIKKIKINNSNILIDKIYINTTMGPSLKLKN
ncbi:MAG: hypothetical protein NHG13_00245 [Candidatus Shikimatogenerans bostrichidophilus]|nr:MAG: hypothetical protein NHG13_00245 [Candidatus Shikimatogenerans bostrichidophilus]